MSGVWRLVIGYGVVGAGQTDDDLVVPHLKLNIRQTGLRKQIKSDLAWGAPNHADRSHPTADRGGATTSSGLRSAGIQNRAAMMLAASIKAAPRT